MPVCHGRLYSPRGSHVGFCRSSRRLAAFGIWSRGSFSSQPSAMSRAVIQNVGARMSATIRLSRGERGHDLREVLVVVVEALEVLHGHPGVLLEGRHRLAVDVGRPVVEGRRSCRWPCRRSAGCTPTAAPAGPAPMRRPRPSGPGTSGGTVRPDRPAGVARRRSPLAALGRSGRLLRSQGGLHLVDVGGGGAGVRGMALEGVRAARLPREAQPIARPAAGAVGRDRGGPRSRRRRRSGG